MALDHQRVKASPLYFTQTDRVKASAESGGGGETTKAVRSQYSAGHLPMTIVAAGIQGVAFEQQFEYEIGAVARW